MLQAVLGMQDSLGNVTKMIVLGYLRPFAFTLIFAGFAWAAVNTSLMRAAFALALTLPVIVPGIPDYLLRRDLPQEWEMIAIGVKEVMIGMALGYIASIPFSIVTAAGGIVDIYRGSSEPASDPSGGSASPFGIAFQVMHMWVFAQAGGLLLISGIIYESYRTWPLLELMPGIDDRGIEAAIMVVQAVSVGALIMAGPLLLVMFVVDAFVGLGGKIAPRLQFNGLDMLLKNLALTILMPFYLTILLQLMRQHDLQLSDFTRLIESFAP